MSTRTLMRRLCLASAVAITIGLTALPAGAIKRAPCNAANVEIFSDHSACFAYAGGVNVKLYNTVGAKGGINKGFVKKATGQISLFYKGKAVTWPSVNVTFVAIETP